MLIRENSWGEVGRVSGRGLGPRPVAREAAAASAQLGRGSGSADFHRLRVRLYGVLLLCDAIAMAAAFLVANVLRFGEALQSYGLTTFALLFPIYCAVGLNGRAWSVFALASPRKSAALAARAVLISTAVATILFFSLKIGEDFSRLVFGTGAMFSLAFIILARLWLGNLLGERFHWTFRRDVLLVDGAQSRGVKSDVVIDAFRENLRPHLDDPLMLDRLGKLLRGSERVIISCPPERRSAWARALAGANVDVEFTAPEIEALGALALRRHQGQPTLLVGRGPLGLVDRAMKRLFDIGLSLVFVVLALPLLACIAIAIRIEAPGPILFRQMRVGRGNMLFEMLKFRTMYADAADEQGDRSTSRNDDRVTRVGRFLRNTSLDELPQLLNVLSGEMSIVGPRPHALGSKTEGSSFWSVDDRYWNRHAAKPGMTGLAQIRGFRGATDKRSDFTDRLQSDLEYLEGWHIGRDFAILARTLGVLLHPNAF